MADDAALAAFARTLGRGDPLPGAGHGDGEGDAGPGAMALALCAWAVGTALPRLLRAAGRPGREAALRALPPVDSAHAARAAHAALAAAGHGSAYDASARARRALGHAVLACQGPGGPPARARAEAAGREVAMMALAAADLAGARALRDPGQDARRRRLAGERARDDELAAILRTLPADLAARLAPAPGAAGGGHAGGAA